MYKLVAMDLDETLLDNHQQICKRNKEAIQKAQEQEVKIVPCSGRGPGFLGDILQALNIDKESEYSILANGAVIVENKTNTLIHLDQMDFEDIKKLFYFGRSKNLGIQIFTFEHVYLFYCDERERGHCMSFGKNIIFREDDAIEDLRDKVIFKILFVKEDFPYLLSLKEELKPLSDNKISVSFSSNRYLELNSLGVNKGEGLKKLANYLNIKMADTIGIGDNLNDLDLIKDAGLGAVVANAREEAKAVAQYICTSDNNQGGVGEVIEKFVLKEVK